VAYGLVTLIHTVNFLRRGARWMWAMIVGGYSKLFSYLQRFDLVRL